MLPWISGRGIRVRWPWLSPHGEAKNTYRPREKLLWRYSFPWMTTQHIRSQFSIFQSQIQTLTGDTRPKHVLKASHMGHCFSFPHPTLFFSTSYLSLSTPLPSNPKLSSHHQTPPPTKLYKALIKNRISYQPQESHSSPHSLYSFSPPFIFYPIFELWTHFRDETRGWMKAGIAFSSWAACCYGYAWRRRPCRSCSGSTTTSNPTGLWASWWSAIGGEKGTTTNLKLLHRFSRTTLLFSFVNCMNDEDFFSVSRRWNLIVIETCGKPLISSYQFTLILRARSFISRTD